MVAEREKKSPKLHHNRPSLEDYNKLNPNLFEEWEDFMRAPFPRAAKGQEIRGVDLVLIRSEIVGSIQTYVDMFDACHFGTTISCDVLENCVLKLRPVVPLLVGDTAVYFKRLLEFCDEVLDRVADAL